MVWQVDVVVAATMELLETRVPQASNSEAEIPWHGRPSRCYEVNRMLQEKTPVVPPIRSFAVVLWQVEMGKGGIRGWRFQVQRSCAGGQAALH